MTSEMTQENMRKAYDAFLQKQNVQGAIRQVLKRVDQESKAGSNSFETGVIVNRGFQQKEFLWRAFMLTVSTFILCTVFEGFGLLPRTPFTLLVAPILGAIASMVITKIKTKQNKKERASRRARPFFNAEFGIIFCFSPSYSYLTEL